MKRSSERISDGQLVCSGDRRNGFVLVSGGIKESSGQWTVKILLLF